MEPPPNVWQFDRYDRYSRCKSKKGDSERVSSVSSSEAEIDGHSPLLSCSGLTLRNHQLISTPTMGIRTKSTTPKLPLPEWQSTISSVEYMHMKPFESSFFGEEKPMYLIGGKRPDSVGHFVEVSNIYSKHHAEQELEELKQHPYQPTEWTKKNMRGRTKTYHQMRLDSVAELDTNSTLYKSGSMILAPDDRAKGEALQDDIREIIKARRRFARESSGLSRMSKTRQKENKLISENMRRARNKEVKDHIAQHDDHILAYRIVFDKFDEDNSGSMDKTELKAALYHMGLDVPEDEAGSLLVKYDVNNDGTLDFEEFSLLAKEAQMAPHSKSLFLSKEVLQKNTK